MPFPFTPLWRLSNFASDRSRHLQLCGLLTFCRWCVLQFLNELHELSHRLESKQEQTQHKRTYSILLALDSMVTNIGPRPEWRDLQKLSWWSQLPAINCNHRQSLDALFADFCSFVLGFNFPLQCSTPLRRHGKANGWTLCRKRAHRYWCPHSWLTQSQLLTDLTALSCPNCSYSIEGNRCNQVQLMFLQFMLWHALTFPDCHDHMQSQAISHPAEQPWLCKFWSPAVVWNMKRSPVTHIKKTMKSLWKTKTSSGSGFLGIVFAHRFFVWHRCNMGRWNWEIEWTWWRLWRHLAGKVHRHSSSQHHTRHAEVHPYWVCLNHRV